MINTIKRSVSRYILLLVFLIVAKPDCTYASAFLQDSEDDFADGEYTSASTASSPYLETPPCTRASTPQDFDPSRMPQSTQTPTAFRHALYKALAQNGLLERNRKKTVKRKSFDSLQRTCKETSCTTHSPLRTRWSLPSPQLSYSSMSSAIPFDQRHCTAKRTAEYTEQYNDHENRDPWGAHVDPSSFPPEFPIKTDLPTKNMSLSIHISFVKENKTAPAQVKSPNHSKKHPFLTKISKKFSKLLKRSGQE
jgi:hypothetical protein